MGNLFTKEVGKVLTKLLGNVLTEVLGKVLDIYTPVGLSLHAFTTLSVITVFVAPVSQIARNFLMSEISGGLEGRKAL